MKVMLVLKDMELLTMLNAIYQKWYKYSQYEDVVQLAKSIQELHRMVLDNFDITSVSDILYEDLFLEFQNGFDWYDLEQESSSLTKLRFQYEFNSYFTMFKLIVTKHLEHSSSSLSKNHGPILSAVLIDTLQDGALLFACKC